MQASRLRRSVLVFSKWAFTPLALFFLLLMLWNSRTTLYSLLDEIEYGLLSVSALIWLGLYFLSPLFTVFILRGLGEKAPYAAMLFIYVSRLPAKYLPGGIWQTVARAYDLKDRGIATPLVSQLIAYEILMPVFAAFAVGGILLTYAGASSALTPAILIALIIAATLGMIFLPKIAQWIPSIQVVKLRRGYYARSIVSILFYWVLAGTSFAAFITALDIAGMEPDYVRLSGAYSMSWGIGYLSFFAPQGIGVLEYTATHLSGMPLSTAAGISVIFCFRLMAISLDFLAWSLLTAMVQIGKLYGKNIP